MHRPHLAILLAVSSFSPSVGGANAPVVPRNVFVTHAADARDVDMGALNALIDGFKDAHKAQLRFVSDDQLAQFSYPEFMFLRTPVGLKLQARYRAGTKPPSNILSRFPEAKVDPLFYDVIEQSLFDEVEGLYRPARILQCRPRGHLMTVGLVIQPPDGLGFEHGLFYVLGEPTTGGPPLRAPIVLSPKELDRDGTDHGEFVVSGAAESTTNFITIDCVGTPPRTRLRTYDRIRSGDLNVPRVSQRQSLRGDRRD